MEFTISQVSKAQFPHRLIKLRILFYRFVLGIKVDNGCVTNTLILEASTSGYPHLVQNFPLKKIMMTIIIRIVYQHNSKHQMFVSVNPSSVNGLNK